MSILMYCHIGKVGGKRVQFYMRSYFGVDFRGVATSKGRFYDASELKSDLAINPRIRFIGGHSVRPHVDYGDLSHRLKWFSFFREPKDRLLSHFYQQSLKKRFSNMSLMEWINKYSTRTYWQIYMVAGERNLDKAIDIVSEKYEFVGLNSQYEKSLLLLASTFGLSDFRFNNRPEGNPPEKPGKFQHVLEAADRYKDNIDDMMALEYKFYDFICDRYGQQVKSYGSERLHSEMSKYIGANRGVC